MPGEIDTILFYVERSLPRCSTWNILHRFGALQIRLCFGYIQTQRFFRAAKPPHGTRHRCSQPERRGR